MQAQLDNQREKEQLWRDRLQFEKEKEELRAEMQKKGSTESQEKEENKEAPKGKPSGVAVAKEPEEWEKIFVLNSDPIPRTRAESTTSKKSSGASSRDSRMDALEGQLAGLEGKMDSAMQKISKELQQMFLEMQKKMQQMQGAQLEQAREQMQQEKQKLLRKDTGAAESDSSLATEANLGLGRKDTANEPKSSGSMMEMKSQAAGTQSSESANLEPEQNEKQKTEQSIPLINSSAAQSEFDRTCTQDPEFVDLPPTTRQQVSKEKIKVALFAGDREQFLTWCEQLKAYIMNTGLQDCGDEALRRTMYSYLTHGQPAMNVIDADRLSRKNLNKLPRTFAQEMSLLRDISSPQKTPHIGCQKQGI